MADLEQVLYVDDDDDIREVAEMALTAVAGLKVCACSSGEEALTQARACRPQLILLDVMMPGMDGPTTLAALREDPELADTPVVFLTAKIQPAEVERYRSLGAADVIGKPFDPMTLGEQLRGIWARLDS
jgi:CheY-like chemotaxis protein